MNTDEQKIAEIREKAEHDKYYVEGQQDITFLLARRDRLQALCRAVVDAGRPHDMIRMHIANEKYAEQKCGCAKCIRFDALAAELNGGGK